ncbi:MAG: ABC transporter ATP-binding protein, partial [Acidimicrobiales bacterium]
GVPEPTAARPGPGDSDRWRGVAAEEAEELAGGVAALLASRSRRLLSGLVRPHRGALALALALVVLEDLANVASPYLVKVGIDGGVPAARRGDLGVLVATALAIAGAGVVGALGRRGFLLVSGRVGQQIVRELRMAVFDHFQRLSLSFHERYTSGRVISRQTSDMDAISELLDTGLDGLVTAVLSVLSIGTVMLVLDLPLGLVAMGAFALLCLLTSWFRRESGTAYRRTREAVALVIVHLVESLGGIRAVQAFGREPRNQSIFDELDDRYRAANQRSLQLIALYVPGIKALGNLTTAAVLLLGGWRALHHEMTVGVLAAFLLYLRQFFEPMQDLSQFYNSFQSASAAVEKLAGVLEEIPSVPEPGRAAGGGTAPGGPAGALRCEGVRFAYRDRDVLGALDLSVPAGQTVALVGETGAGKSTLARLVARFYDPGAGRITLDGVDLRHLDEEALRRAVVMVTQEGFLFSGTVAENVELGRPGAGRDEVERVAAAIGAHDLIASLPQGYDTQVAKRGGRLSSGQRQLVAFARAFLADPDVLILDEATSSLDVPSERLVQRALRTILAERTALVIAHRLTTVEIADRVLVMDAGRIVEDGPPSILLGRGGRYGELHRAWAASLV